MSLAVSTQFSARNPILPTYMVTFWYRLRLLEMLTWWLVEFLFLMETDMLLRLLRWLWIFWVVYQNLKYLNKRFIINVILTLISKFLRFFKNNSFSAKTVTFEVQHKPGYRLKIRIGMHTGSVVGGVVGTKIPHYSIFGDTVEIAGLMESSGQPMKVD